VDVYIHIFLTSSLLAGEWSASRPGRFTPRERAPGTHWIGGWVNPRTGLDDVEKRKFLNIPGLELRPLGRPARSQSLYRLRYPGSLNNLRINKLINLPLIRHYITSAIETVYLNNAIFNNNRIVSHNICS
jgi:hypothetical protein